MRLFKRGDYVEVFWEDAYGASPGHDGWKTAEDIAAEEDAAAMIISVGIVFRHTEQKLRLEMSMDEDNDVWSGQLVIPCEYIHRVRKLSHQ